MIKNTIEIQQKNVNSGSHIFDTPMNQGLLGARKNLIKKIDVMNKWFNSHSYLKANLDKL